MSGNEASPLKEASMADGSPMAEDMAPSERMMDASDSWSSRSFTFFVFCFSVAAGSPVLSGEACCLKRFAAFSHSMNTF